MSDPETVRAAIAEVRREGRKAAAVHAAVDATLAALAVNLAVTVTGMDRSAAVPASIRGVTPAAPASLPVGTLLALGIGLAVLAAELAYRSRQPTVERFEAVNPPVAEALRTARDAVERDRDGWVARELYGDVIDRLAETSSVGLVDLRRLALSIAVVVALSLATVQASVVGVEVGVPSPGAAASGGDGGVAGVTPTPGGLGSGEAVLGEPENVSAGSRNLSAAVGAGGGRGDRERAYDSSGLASDAEVEAQRAGYTTPPHLEDAELIKRYNLEIRENDDDD